MGWSSPSRTARTPSNIAGELHELLDRGRNQATLHPGRPLFRRAGRCGSLHSCTLKKSASMVLVDPMRCDEWPPDGSDKTGRARPRLETLWICDSDCPTGIGSARGDIAALPIRDGSRGIGRAAGEGGKHVLGRVKSEVGKMPREVWPIVAAHWSRPGYYAGMRSHVNAVRETVREMHELRAHPGIPVMVLTTGKCMPLSEDCLSRIGDNVQQVIAPASAHWIHLDEPATGDRCHPGDGDGCCSGGDGRHQLSVDIVAGESIQLLRKIVRAERS